MNSASIGHFSPSLIVQLLDPAVRAIAFAFFVALVLRLWRTGSADFRLRLWRVVLCFALALPVLGWAVPSVRLRLPWPQPHTPAQTSQAPLGWLHSHLTELSEQAADDSALFVVEDRAYYSEVVMSFLDSVRRAAGRIRMEAVSMPSCGRASRRIDRILNGEIRLLPAIGRRAWFGLIFPVTPIVVFTAAVHPTIRQHIVTSTSEHTPVLSAMGQALAPASVVAASTSIAQQTTAPSASPTPRAKLEETAPPKPGPAKVSEDRQGDEPWLIVSSEPNQILLDTTKAGE